MSNDNPPKQKRSFKTIFKIFKFIIALLLTFTISFAITLALKSSEPDTGINADDKPAKSVTTTKIKTLFDERNNRPFDPTNYEGVRDQGSVVREKTLGTNSDVTPARQADDTGFFAAIDRIADIKPAVDDKIKTIPHYVTMNNLPPILCQAIVSVEDTRFYQHKGFDLIGIARAIMVNAEAGEIQQGASTITQQTVKNLFLTSDRTFTRKAEELILSMNLEKNFDKDKILEIYLNSIYFGSNFYGIHDAAQGYFAKEPADLTIAECAMLAGLPNAPSLNSPYVDFHRAKERQLVVINAMEKLGVITKVEAENARIEEIILAR